MAEVILNVFVDGLMVLLLVVTIFYCWKLNKRIKVLQDSKSELASIIQKFDESTQMASRSIGDIHTATSRISENIQHKIDKANYLADDLQFMIEKGNKIADRMEGDISASRKAKPSNPSSARKSSARSERPERVAPDLDEKAEAPPSAKSRGAARKAARSEPAGGGDASKASLESVLQRVSKKKGGAAPKDAGAETQARAKRPAARLRSKSEQELFDALKDVGEV